MRALKRSAIAITSVIIVELALGLIVNSLAIVSDGLHAMLDALTTFVLLVATRASIKPPDAEHMYGHEKFEAIGGFFGGISLICVALLIIYESLLKMINAENVNLGIEYIGFIAIGYTFCIDFFRVGTLFKARSSESTTMKAGFYHAIADLSSTIIAFIGFGLATLGFSYGDSIASIILGILLSYLSIKLVWSTGMELTDTISKDVTEKVKKQILNTKGVRKYKDLKIRKAGEKTFVQATVQVPDYMNLEESHDLASKIEEDIKKMLGKAEVSIHIEPHLKEMLTEELVEKLAKKVSEVKDAHEISAVSSNGKLYITLHASVNPKLSVKKAHEIAEKIENEIIGSIHDVENVTVHVEPFSEELHKGSAADENEVNEIIHKATENYQNVLKIQRIVTYVSDKKRYINIDYRFTKQTSVEEAHKIASQIEENIEEHYAETIVTVHMETDE
ncbi:MAG TPA: cation diffusion facilitator family transporter [Candidatus Bathyarchaeia archaeon]|nr:cation diffusion facilitator family transporter [Candidatus Bathyarchaeia archaeon]